MSIERESKPGHTPEPCGCGVVEDRHEARFESCPDHVALHEAAPRMLVLLKRASAILETDGAREGYDGEESYDDTKDGIAVLIAEVEG